jgi:hypothetical protein
MREHNVSETGSVSVLRSGGGENTLSVGSLRKSYLNRWKTEVKNNHSYINTWGQALSMGDNRKKNNNNYDKACPELKLI